MPQMLQVTFDCADVPAMVAFWSATLGYEPEPPPPGFATWEDFGRAHEIPEDMWDHWGAAVDPAGEGPRFFFQRVPEGKTAKNRMHLDVRLSSRPDGGGLAEEVRRLEGLGAQRGEEREELGSHWVVMSDVEGNEFCVS